MKNSQSTGRAISDGVITAKARAALAADPITATYEISVTTLSGVVELSGFVETTIVRTEALQLVRTISGVLQVEDAMDLRTFE